MLVQTTEPIQTIRISELWPSKLSLSYSSVEQYRDLPNIQPVDVIRIENKVIVIDGNSRVRSLVPEEDNQDPTWTDKEVPVRIHSLDSYSTSHIFDINTIKDAISTVQSLIDREIESKNHDVYIPFQCVLVRNPPKSKHKQIVSRIAITFVGQSTLFNIFLRSQEQIKNAINLHWSTIDINYSEYISICTLFLLTSFWIVYFQAKAAQLPNLSQFLDFKTYRTQSFHEDENTEHTAIELRQKAISERSLSGIASQGAFAGVAAIFLGAFTAGFDPKTPIQTITRDISVFFGVLTILLSLWSIELFDTSQNVFKGSHVERLRLRAHFSRHVGLFGTGGGLIYRFYSFVASQFFIVSALLAIRPFTAMICTFFIIYLGYAPLFAYKCTYEYNKITDCAIDTFDNKQKSQFRTGSLLLFFTTALTSLYLQQTLNQSIQNFSITINRFENTRNPNRNSTVPVNFPTRAPRRQTEQ